MKNGKITIHDHICYVLYKAGQPLTRDTIMISVHINRGFPMTTFKRGSNISYFTTHENAGISARKNSTYCRGLVEKVGKRGSANLWDITPAGLACALKVEEILSAR